MKRRLSLFLLLLAALLLCACAQAVPVESGPAPTDTPLPTPAPTSAPVPTPTPETTPTPTPTPTPVPRNSIVLEQGEELDWPCGLPFTDPGYLAFGSEGEDMTQAVQVSGAVTCWQVGDYVLSYSLSDASGELSSARRMVHVIPAELPETIHQDGAIYLTFDDGPSSYTAQVLDILAKYDVKATFFIVADRQEHLELLQRIVDEGHTLGIHCYSHVYDELYKSPESFFTDFMRAQQVIYEYTGQYAQVSRLPGGSWTASYMTWQLPGRYDEFRERMHNMGVRYYDWDVQPESSSRTTEGTLWDFTHPAEPYDGTVVLQHDTRNYSVFALERMIQWGLEQGYRFLPIDLTTPEVHFA